MPTQVPGNVVDFQRAFFHTRLIALPEYAGRALVIGPRVKKPQLFVLCA